MSAFPFAIPGDITSPTGGYAYARRLLRDGPDRGLHLLPVALPPGFPLPSPAELAETERLLSGLAQDVPLLIDGLAYGAMPLALIRTIAAPIVVLCHHPLGMEAGIEPALASHLMETERKALGCARHVITTSHATGQLLTEAFNVPGERITTAPPGTDPAPRAPGSGGPTCRILSVGSLTPRKGHDRLISALAVHKDLPWTLRIAGHAPFPEIQAELEKLIRRTGLSDRVVLSGPLSTGALTAAYQQADLFALASGFEGFGMAFTEAMSHGLPVVGLDVPAVAEATGGAACLVSEGALSRTLGQLIANDEARRELAENCWTAAQTFLRWTNTATIVRDVLEREIT